MNLKTFTILLALLLAVGVKAQTPGNAHPKREFRAAWIQTVNGQFKGMSTEKIKQTLVGQLNSLPVLMRLSFKYARKPMLCMLHNWNLGAVF